MSNRWYCIAILPQFTKKVKFHLDNQNFPSFFPEIVLHPTKQIMPMFKGYAFVQFDINVHQWLSINSTYGVIKLVPKHLLHPLPVNESFMDYLIENSPMPEEQLVEWLMKLIEEKSIQNEFYVDQIVKLKESLDPLSPYITLEGRQATVLQVREKLLEISFQLISGNSNAIWVDKSSVIPDNQEAIFECSDDYKGGRVARQTRRRAVAIS